MSPVDKTTRQDLILRLISERDLGLVPAQTQVVVHPRDGTAGAVSSVLDRVKGLKILGTIAGQDTVLAIAPNASAAAEVANLIADVCRAKTRPAGNVE